jgi:hypothetical protein
VVLFLWYDYDKASSPIEQAAQNRVTEETRLVVQQIDAVLAKLLSVARQLADDLSTGNLPRSQIHSRLEEAMEKTLFLYGIGVAYIPYANNPHQRRQSPYYLNRSKSLQTQDLLQQLTVPCRFPSTPNKISNCVVFIDYSLNDIQAMMSTLDLGKTGYGFILSKQGVFISHPIPEYVKDRKTIFNIAALKDDKALNRLGKRAINGENGVIEYIDDITGQSSWIFYQPIPATGWTMCTVVIKDEILGNTNDFRQKNIWLSLWLIVFLVFFSALLFRADIGDSHRLWAVASLASVLLVVGIGFIWYLAQAASFREGAGSATMVDKAGLHQFLSANAKQRLLSQKKPPIYVPTGIVIESIEFLGASNVILTGHIWQKYDDDLHKGISRDFILPEVQSPSIIEAYRHKENKTEVIGWSFEGTVHQPHDYSNYPLDRRKINLLIQHKDFDKNVILTPDLKAYKWVNPNARPGLKRDLVLSDWNIRRSFFNYRTLNYDSHFGTDNDVIGEMNFPNLYFSVFMQRDFLTKRSLLELPSLSVLVLIVVGILLFAFLLLLGKVGTFANLLAPLGVLFIGLLLAHIGLRKAVPASGILYIEYYYLVMYIAVLAVVAGYFLFHANKNLFFIQYREGLVAKLLFWPLILGSFFGMTLWTFQ